MKAFFLLLLFPVIAFSQGKPEQVEDLFKDLPVAERITKRMELARDILSGKEKKYDMKQATVLYALNVKDQPDHAHSWHEWISRILVSGSTGAFSYTPEVIKKVEPMLKMALRKSPNNPGLQIMKLKIRHIKGDEPYKMKEALEKLRAKSDQLEYSELFNMAQLYVAIKEPVLASDVFKRMETKAKTTDEHFQASHGRGQSAITAENWNDCADAYQEAEKILPQIFQLKVSVVGCLNKAKRFDEAVSYEGRIGNSSEANCNMSEALIGKAHNLIDAGKYDEAEALLNRSLKCPKWEGYEGLAKNYVKKKDFDKARDFLYKSLELYGTEKAPYLLGWSAAFKPSIRHFKEILQKSIDQEQRSDTKMNSYYELVKEMANVRDPGANEVVVKAVASAELALAQYSEHYEFLKYFGGIYGISGTILGNPSDLAKAKMIFAKCKQLRPYPDDFVNGWIAQVGMP